MKSYILQLILVVVLLSSCAPKTDDEIQPVSTVTAVTAEATSVPIEKVEVGKMLDGQWSYECDVLGFKRYTWTSSMEFAHADMVAQISFDDLDTIPNNPSTLAFIIKSPQPDYELDWLYIHTDGTFDPELGYFDKYGLMEVYPGGYPAFEKELSDMNIDWVNMYLKAKVEFLAMYLSNNEQCAPAKQFDTQSV